LGLINSIASRSARAPTTPGRDIVAGLVLTGFLVPVGMGYATASGLPPVYGLYATIVPLLVYALAGPSRVLVLGPDSSLAPLIAATILPLAAGDTDRAILLAGALAIGSGVICLLAGLANFGFLSELLSTPVRHGYLNGIAVVVILSQLPTLLGFDSESDTPLGRFSEAVSAIGDGSVDATTIGLAFASLAVIVILRRMNNRIPAVLVAMVLATVVVAAFDLADTVATVGRLPEGLPEVVIPSLERSDLAAIVVGSFTVAVLTFADTGLLSKAYAQRRKESVDTNQELIALGLANMATGLTQGFPISASSSRTPVAEAAGSSSQLTGVVSAFSIAAFLVFAPGMFVDLPSATLAAIVVIAVLGLIEIPAVRHLYSTRRQEFWLSIGAAVGVVAVGALWGVGIAVLMSLLAFIERGRRPNTATLVRVEGIKGYHEHRRHLDGEVIPGLMLYRFDAPLFFANAELFRSDLLERVERQGAPVRWVVVTAEPITNIDATADEMLCELHADLEDRGILLAFAELKGVVRDVLERTGTTELVGRENFFPTIGRAVSEYERRIV